LYGRQYWVTQSLSLSQAPEELDAELDELDAELLEEGALEQVPVAQTPLTQSASVLQPLPAPHLGHVAPPQSTSVSSPSLMPSVQCDTHAPWPLQWSPPLSAHAAPAAAYEVAHWFASHAAVEHAFPKNAQSFAFTHSTHVPAPSQTVPARLHRVPVGRLFDPQQPATHV
jgi:hypothetical protein